MPLPSYNLFGLQTLVADKPNAVSFRFTKFWHDVGNPSYFPKPSPNCLRHVVFTR